MGRLLIRFFWDIYDFIGRLILLNILGVVISIPIITFPGALAGLLYVMSIISSDREPAISDFFVGFRRFFGRFLLLFLLYAVVIAVLILNVQFYINPSIIPGQFKFIAALLAGIFFWILVILLSSIFYTFPALVKKDLPLMKAVKHGFLMLLANPWITISALIVTTLLMLLSLITAIGPFFFSFIFLAASLNATYDTAMERVETIIERQTQTQKVDEKPTSWHQIKDAEKKTEDKQRKKDRYSRTFRDIFRPWDYK